MLNLITVAAVLLLFCRSYSTALNCPSVSVCEEDATMFNNGFSGSTRAGDKHKEPPTFTVEKFIGTIGSPWKNEFKGELAIQESCYQMYLRLVIVAILTLNLDSVNFYLLKLNESCVGCVVMQSKLLVMYAR